MTPARALEELRAGNQRFVAGEPRARDLRADVRATSSAQHPFAVTLSCVDSRQPIEIIFDLGFGDVFSARVAGNVLNDDILGSMEFACKVAGARLIAVVGHTGCGAITGAVNGVELGHLTGLLAKIRPASIEVSGGAPPRTPADAGFVDRVAEANVRLVVRQIRDRSPILRDMLDQGRIMLVGGMYDLSTGRVTFLPR
jgi:carbonic anhydrase